MEKRENLIKTALICSLLFGGWMILWTFISFILYQIVQQFDLSEIFIILIDPNEIIMWESFIFPFIWITGIFPVFLITVAQTVSVIINCNKKIKTDQKIL